MSKKVIEEMVEEIEVRESTWNDLVTRLENDECQLNSVDDVESDHGETAQFMTEDEVENAKKRDQLEFVSEQRSVEKLRGKKGEGNVNFVSQII